MGMKIISDGRCRKISFEAMRCHICDGEASILRDDDAEHAQASCEGCWMSADVVDYDNEFDLTYEGYDPKRYQSGLKMRPEAERKAWLDAHGGLTPCEWDAIQRWNAIHTKLARLAYLEAMLESKDAPKQTKGRL
jgi:hypothetical protein